MQHLLNHATTRGATDPDGPLLHYATGRPISRRRYDYIWNRVKRHLPWAATQQISTHWLRHTTLTWIERHFGFATAHAYAGHFNHHDTATGTYVKASLEDIATALAHTTQPDKPSPHPDNDT
ncbi:hypothetical protein [Amycolatopsis pithecellobii]|uniref:hypothetical protein n=1 Tax=Amycolatopsis pithecellobii TaxID=664692 RepID=UPI0035E411A4